MASSPRGSLLRLALCAVAALPARAESRLEVLTLNVWHGLRPKAAWRLAGEPEERRQVRLAAQLDALAEIAADLVFLQEVNPAPALARRYAERLGFDEVHKVDACGIRIGSVGVPTNVRSGLAILGRPGLELRRLGSARLSGLGGCSDAAGFQLGESRYALFAEITHAGRRVLLVNVHLRNVPCGSAGFEERLAQLVRAGELPPDEAAEVEARVVRRTRRQEQEALALASAIERRAGRAPYAAIVVAGDLNAEPGSETLNTLVRHGFVPALEPLGPPAPSYDPLTNAENAALAAPATSPYPTFGRSALVGLYAAERARPRRIDHVLVRGALEIRATTRTLDQPRAGLYLSDHFAIRARLVASCPPASE